MPFLRPVVLHIPDGFLNIPTAVFFWLVSGLIIRAAVKKLETEQTESMIPMMGIMAAFIFAGQMINFPIAGGTSGHLLGGALAAITLGPWAAILVMTTVISVQALVFQDGGLLALGANIFNMGILPVMIGFGIYRITAGRSANSQWVSAGVGAWLSVLAGAVLTALQLWISGIASLKVVMPVMAGVHTLIGIGEALITVSALAFIRRNRPDAFAETSRSSGAGWTVTGLLAALLVLLLAPFASTNPDGLERVAKDLGFFAKGQSPGIGIFSGYQLPVLGNTDFSTIAAGLVGIFFVLMILFLISRYYGPNRGKG